MRTMNVCEYSEYVNHKDRGVKYPEYREEVPSRRSIPSKKVAGRDVVSMVSVPARVTANA